MAAAELPIMLAYGEALAGTGKPLVAAGSIGSPGDLGRSATEEDPALPGGDEVGGDEYKGTLRVRNDVETAVVGLAERGVRSSVVRIANIAHSTTDRAGFFVQLIALAKERGFVGYPGDGANLWNAVHHWQPSGPARSERSRGRTDAAGILRVNRPGSNGDSI